MSDLNATATDTARTTDTALSSAAPPTKHPLSDQQAAASVRPLKKRAKLSSSESNKQSNQMHAHFDCFSGAAGDMMLAACLDAADDSSELATTVVETLQAGLPAMASEFQLSHQRVWRGMGSICARHVTIQSIYQHRPAPVPANITKDGSKASATAEHHGGREETSDDKAPAASSDDHDHHSHSHEHGHNHRRTHEHSHSHQSGKHGDRMEEEPSSTHHSHTHEHSSTDSHSHSHSHAHANTDDSSDAIKGPLRNLPEIRSMLQTPAAEEHLPAWVREVSIEAFTELAKAEAAVHGAASTDAVHFHEVGAVDSVVDMIGTVLALYLLGVTTVSCSPLPLGQGTVWTAHGLLPVPAPATLHLMKDMPTTPGPPGLTGELVTPTGAALLKVLTRCSSANKKRQKQSGRPPCFTIRRVGMGAGTKDFHKHPNVIRLLLGNDVIRDGRK